jgi:hypothetical protein
VLVIMLGLLALVGFAVLIGAARRGSLAAHHGALFESGLLVAPAVLGVLFSAVLLLLGCDESCEDGSGQWWHTDGAWQWWGQFAATVLGTIALVATFIALLREHYRAALALMTLAAACFGAWAAFLAPLGDRFGI